MTTIKLSEDVWNSIYLRLAREHADRPSVLIIREVGRRELGFTVRRHREWVPDERLKFGRPGGDFQEEIHLDFDDPAMATLFRMKYL